MKIIILLMFITVAVSLVLLFIYMLKTMYGSSVAASVERKNLELALKKHPAAWQVWLALELCITKIENIKKPGQNDKGAEWELYHQRLDKNTALMRRVMAYIETNPQDVIRFADMEYILPTLHDFFNGYYSCLTLGEDTPSGKEYLTFIKTGLDSTEKILNNYIEVLYQNKSINLRAEIDVMLNWYGKQKETISHGNGERLNKN